MAVTEYVILVCTAIEESLHWTEWGTLSASSADAAIRAAAAKSETGKFVAIPARSWQPRTVTVETKTAVTFAKDES